MVDVHFPNSMDERKVATILESRIPNPQGKQRKIEPINRLVEL
jgi:hypothetical protein